MIHEKVIEALWQPSLVQQIPFRGGASIDWFTLEVEPWHGERFNTNGDDCNKRSSLLTGDDGRMSCLEVEVVRRLLAADVGLQAGWVQAWSCGANSWSRWIWKALPPPIASRNAAIQERRAHKPTSRGGHPDVAVLLGSEVFYVECKVNDPVDKQIDWISAGLELGVIHADQVIVLYGVMNQANPIDESPLRASTYVSGT